MKSVHIIFESLGTLIILSSLMYNLTLLMMLKFQVLSRILPERFV